MKTKLFFMLVSFFSAAVFASGTVKKNNKVILSGNLLSNSQIVPVGGQAKTVMASGSGKIRFSSTRYCGDGDVANYHNKHPTTQFYDAAGSTTNIVVGYWLSPEGSLDTAANKFFAIGYTPNSKIDSEVTEKLLTPHFSDQGARQTFELIKEAMKDAAAVAESTKYANVTGNSTTKYNMKFVAMACPKLQNDVGSNSTSGMSALKIAKQFTTGTNLVGMTNLKDYMHDSILEPNGTITKSQMRVETAGSANYNKSIDLQFTGGSGASLSSELTNLINDMANTPKPAVTSTNISLGVSPTISCSCDRLNYSGDMAAIRGRIENLKTRLNAAKNDKNICDAGGSIRFDSLEYPWESFRTNASCQVYHKMITEQLSTLEAAFDNLFNDPALNKNTCATIDSSIAYASCPVASLNLDNISDTEFNNRKVTLNKSIMKIVGTPNAIQVAQDRLKSQITNNPGSYALNTTSCFPINAGSGEFIKSISSSVGIHVNPNPTVPGQLVLTIDKKAVSHPEGNFAIGGDARYLTPSGNNLILFNNTGGDPKLDSAFKLELGMNSYLTVTTGTANVVFHARSIGCSQNIYCLNDR